MKSAIIGVVSARPDLFSQDKPRVARGRQRKDLEMKRLLTMVAGLVVVVLLVIGASVVKPSKTGDRDLDAQLVKIDEKAKADPDVFFRQLSQQHNIPEAEIRQEKERRGLGYGDTYMAAALSRLSKRPIGAVAEEYKPKEGKGWGVMAMNMGIKPGSPEFHQMKDNAGGSVKHMDTVAKEKKNQKKLEKERAQEQERKIKENGQGKGQGKDRK
jgi:hypothetical protein